MTFETKGGTDKNPIWMPYTSFQAMELINSIKDNPRRNNWIMRVDGVEKTLKQWFEEGVPVESETFLDMLSE
jgi:uncharacterized membrane protein YbaN (DUF454 family)